MPTLNWIGKEKVQTHHLDVSYRIMEHGYGFTAENGEQFDPVESGNKIIYGDNLEALKSLLPFYEGKVDCIYIDPPYNTGEENWIYSDNVSHPRIKKWLGQVVGKQSEDLSRHDKWLCMMYPRLVLLKQLLRDTGVIFVSINFRYEHAHLKCILNEIFGENNYIGEITWDSTTQPINSGSARFGLQQKVEPIAFYAKDKNKIAGFQLEEIESGLNYPHIGKLGNCRFEVIEKSDAGGYKRDTMKFEILGQTPREGKRWQIGQETAIELEKLNRLEIVDGIVKKAIYPEDEIDKRKFKPFWSHIGAEIVGTAQAGKEILNTVMGQPLGFDTVKPPKLIEELLSHFSKNAIILDSFAGSGTTAHAVLNLNKKDRGNRKFILVELEDYANDITAERVKRVIKGYGEGNNAVEGTGGDFNFYTLGQSLLDDERNLNIEMPMDAVCSYIWYTETHTAYEKGEQSLPLLGVYQDTAYYLNYIPNEVTTLDRQFLKNINVKANQYVIYADNCLLPKELMQKYNIIFKKIPRDISQF